MKNQKSQKSSSSARSSVKGPLSGASRNSYVGSAKDDAMRRAMDIRQDVETAIHVLDNGVNRTPLPLQQHRTVTGMRQRHKENTELGSSIFQSSFMSSDGQSISKFGAGSFSMSMHQESSMENSQSMLAGSRHRASETSVSVVEGSRGGVELSRLMEEGDRANVLGGRILEKPQPMSDADRRAWARMKTTVTLTETPTIFLFNHQDELISNENKEEVAQVKARNAAYAVLEEEHRLDEGTRFQEKSAITFIAPKKSIHSEVHPPRCVDSGALQVTPWMLKDQFAPLLDEADDEDDEEKKDDEDLLLEEEVQEDSMADGASEGNSTHQTSVEGGASRKNANDWMLADTLMSSLRIMERAVVQNIMEKTQLAYRGIDMQDDCARVAPVANAVAALSPKPTKDNSTPQWMNGGATKEATPDLNNDNAGSDAGDKGSNAAAQSKEMLGDLPLMHMSPDFKALWRYHAPVTKGRSVTCMAWNRKEPDILAVGYSVRRPGAVEDAPAVDANGKKVVDLSTQRGMICCWSLKNPLAPELVLHLNADAGVSSLSFSYEHPSILAVGNTEGGIVVYDIQKDLASPSIVPALSAGLHTGAVWDLKWVPGGKDRGEFLMSISADGRVVQWAVGKTVEKIAPDLMHLKRQPGSQVESAFVEGVAAADEAAGRRRRGGAKAEAVLSRQAGGMCFDVCPSDHAIYVVGTEDGSLFQCNKSQTESYDLDYVPHSDLVYRVRWSPYSARYFLTCSADWTTRLYALSNSPAAVKYDSPNQDAVQDVAWSYTNALFFATATAQGNIELWSVLDSIYPRASIQYEDHRRLNCVLFAEQETPVVVVGDDEGEVTVFLLTNDVYKRHDMTDDEQEMWLEEAVKKQAA